jgi:septal ring factor EnvC (AmiA/AmiB activator)
MASTNTKLLTPSFIASVVGWALTLSVFIWNFSAKSAAMEYRLETLEDKTSMMEQRMKEADTLRTTIQTQLAEIKTDLIWIRNELTTRKDD